MSIILDSLNKIAYYLRGLLNMLEETLIDPLSAYIFDVEEELGVGRKIRIRQFKDKPKFSFEIE